MSFVPLTGGCNCGAVRFEVTAAPLAAAYCDCRRCQRRSGTAASASAFVPADAFRVTTGEDVIRLWHPENGGEKWFCPECGSAIYARNAIRPEVVGVRMGAFDDDPGVRPAWRQFVAYAAPWEPIPDDGLPRHDERPPL